MPEKMDLRTAAGSVGAGARAAVRPTAAKRTPSPLKGMHRLSVKACLLSSLPCGDVQ